MKRVGEDLGRRQRRSPLLRNQVPSDGSETAKAGFAQRLGVQKTPPAFWLSLAVAVPLGIVLATTQHDQVKPPDPAATRWMSNSGNGDDLVFIKDTLTLVNDIPIGRPAPIARMREDCIHVSQDATTALDDPPPKHYEAAWASSIRMLKRDADRCAADAESDFHVKGDSEDADFVLVEHRLINVQDAYRSISGNTGNSGLDFGPP
jgi:hypothetical protein